MKKKTLLVLSVAVLLAVPAHSQLLEAVGNPIVVAGGTYQLTAPVVGNRAALLLSANVAGFKMGTYPVYIGGVGVALPTTVSTVAASFGNFVQLTIPGVTWYPAGNNPGTLGKICLQVGYSYILNGDVRDHSGLYAGVGFGWDSPAYMRYKREAKQAKLRGIQGPENPYDVKP